MIVVKILNYIPISFEFYFTKELLFIKTYDKRDCTCDILIVLRWLEKKLKIFENAECSVFFSNCKRQQTITWDYHSGELAR